MATNKPRLILTLEPEQHQLISKLACLQSRPASKVALDVLELAFPVLEKVAKALERAEDIKSYEITSLALSLERSNDKIQQPLFELLSLLENLGVSEKNPLLLTGGSDFPKRSSK